jgi:hypothetical protein
MLILQRFVLAASAAILIAAPPALAPQSEAPAPSDQAKFIFLLQDGFRGWVCVDFGVAGAKPLPREGDAYIIRPQHGQVLQTSDTTSSAFLSGEAWYEIDGQRRPLPNGVTLQPGPMRSGSTEQSERKCAFVGTEDERGSAAPPPGFENLRQSAPIPAEERAALIALYRAAGGDHWTHRAGWLGPAGTECNWHGVQCTTAGSGERIFSLELEGNNLAGEVPASIGQLSKLESLNLSANHLTGEIPTALGRLRHMDWLSLYGNHFSGQLPGPTIQKWLAGPLQITAEADLLTDVSEIDYESGSTSALCATHRITLRADQSAASYTEKCRNASPGDRTTFCEVKHGRVGADEFATLAWLIKKNGFFDFNAEYSRNITDVGFENIRVTQSGKTHAVSNYAGGGPFELWVIQRAIEGVAASVEWDNPTTQEQCPAW